MKLKCLGNNRRFRTYLYSPAGMSLKIPNRGFDSMRRYDTSFRSSYRAIVGAIFALTALLQTLLLEVTSFCVRDRITWSVYRNMLCGYKKHILFLSSLLKFIQVYSKRHFGFLVFQKPIV